MSTAKNMRKLPIAYFYAQPLNFVSRGKLFLFLM